MADQHINQYVSQALKYGAIKKGPCEFCRATENVHAHHDDYNKPLDIKWLCGKCHTKYHHVLKSKGLEPIRSETTLRGRTQGVMVGLTVIEMELVRRAANRAGKSMSAFIRDKVLYQKGGIFDGGRKPKQGELT